MRPTMLYPVVRVAPLFVDQVDSDRVAERNGAGLDSDCGSGFVGKERKGEDELERWFHAQVESGVST